MLKTTSFRIVDLTQESTWNPWAIMTRVWPKSGFSKVSSAPFASIRPNHTAASGPLLSVISCQELKALEGRKDSSYFVGPSRGMLHVGDLLISSFSGRAILITPELMGCSFSRNHIALRGEGKHIISLWALLNSKTGRNIVTAQQTRAAFLKLTVADILDAGLPNLPHDVVADFEQVAVRIDFKVHELGNTEQSPTWWRTTHLGEHSWEQILATPDPEFLTQGTKLADYAAIEIGRHDSSAVTQLEASEGFLPVASAGFVAGKEPGQVVARDTEARCQHLVHSGQMIVSSGFGGVRTRRVECDMVLGVGTAKVTAHAPAHQVHIDAFLQSSEFKQKLALLLFSHVAQMLTRNIFNQMTMSKPLNEYQPSSPSPESDVDIEAMLEEKLWV